MYELKFSGFGDNDRARHEALQITTGLVDSFNRSITHGMKVCAQHGNPGEGHNQLMHVEKKREGGGTNPSASWATCDSEEAPTAQPITASVDTYLNALSTRAERRAAFMALRRNTQFALESKLLRMLNGMPAQQTVQCSQVPMIARAAGANWVLFDSANEMLVADLLAVKGSE